MSKLQVMTEVELDADQLAEMFCGMCCGEQARFFAKIKQITDSWPGAGLCQQACSICSVAPPDALAAIRTLASHLPENVS